MQHKRTELWREGFIQARDNKIYITQCTNVVMVTVEQRDAFLQDVQDCPVPPPTPGVGYGGTVAPLKPKSMDDILWNLSCLGKGWKSAMKK
jgi:hypothetical protein